MSNGFPAGPQRPVCHVAPRLLSPPRARVGQRLPPALPHHLPLDGSLRTHPLPSPLRNPNLRPRNHPSSPRHPQGHRDLSSPSPLVLSRHNAFKRNVHEARQVSQTSKQECQLPRAHQLPPDPHGLRPLPNHLPPPSNPSHNLHARRPHVLPSLTNPRPLLPSPPSAKAPCKPRSPPRINLHRPLSSPQPLHLHHSKPNPPLHPRKPRRGQLQSAPPSFVLAPHQLHLPPLPHSHSDHSGILGPCPLSSHPTRTSPPRPQILPPTRPLLPSPLLQLPTTPNRSSLLPNPRRDRTPLRHFPSATTTPPARSNGCLQRPLHLHPRSPNSANLRPSRFRQDPVQQTRTRLGYFQRLGQSPDLRPPHLPHPSKRQLPPLPKSHPQPPALPLPTLASSRRHRRSFPLLPHPPSHLPPIVFASPKGKVHFRLPSLFPSQTPSPKPQSPPPHSNWSSLTFQFPSPAPSLLPPAPHTSTDPFSPSLPIPSPSNSAQTSPQSVDSLPRSSRTLATRLETFWARKPSSPTRHLPRHTSPLQIQPLLGTTVPVMSISHSLPPIRTRPTPSSPLSPTSLSPTRIPFSPHSSHSYASCHSPSRDSHPNSSPRSDSSPTLSPPIVQSHPFFGASSLTLHTFQSTRSLPGDLPDSSPRQPPPTSPNQSLFPDHATKLKYLELHFRQPLFE
uniref:Movement protein n=1 Tax=Valeriana jatamansi tymovirus 1 TaxID=3075581 RepID=A0AA96HDG8_9VIRU|nr:putative movement protein [Valeriana jatamansi tymovirus 1]